MHRAGAMCLTAPAVSLLTALLLPVVPGAQAAPVYRHDLGPVPQSGAEASRSLEARADLAIRAKACGEELEFFAAADELREGFYDGDVYPGLIAKVAFLGRSGSSPCAAEVAYPELDPARPELPWSEPFAGRRWRDPVEPLLERSILDSINRVFVDRYGDACTDAVRDLIVPEAGAGPRLLRFELSAECLRAEIRVELAKRERTGNPGSSGLPCGASASPRADWDMAVYQLTRFAYLAREEGAELDPQSRAKLDQLLTLSGPLGAESYSLLGCGNPDNSHGSARERAGEADFYDDGFFADLGGLLDWLMKFLAVVAILLAPQLLPALSGAVAGPYVAATMNVLTAAGGSLAVNLIRIPETENHLLMINTSKYLQNQRIIEELTDRNDRERFARYNRRLREWLLDRFQLLLEEDFVEYNSRPYSRLSIGAILNIHDFADDSALRTGAGAVLDYAAAKAAVASSQGRRIVPFRRLAGTNALYAYGRSLVQPAPQPLFKLTEGADHMLAAMMLWTGETRHSTDGRASLGAVAEMMPEATSRYRPHPLILDIAIDKSAPYEQRIHHAGWEIYSSGRGWLLTAGGTSTGFAQRPLIAPFEFETTPPLATVVGLFKDENRGAGVPTILLPHSATVRQDRYRDFLRFEGNVKLWSRASPGDHQPLSFDDNLCVRRGFACGIRLIVPAAIEACLQRPPGVPANLFFIDSRLCPPYQGAERFFVAIYRARCSFGFEDCKGGFWGFVEAVDVGPDASLAAFADDVVQRNGAHLAAMAGAASADGIGPATWVSAHGETLRFDADAHADNGDDYGILSIDGRPDADGSLDNWKLARGDVLSADGNGRVKITRPGDPRVITLDLSDAEAPRRALPPL